jgi:hypothetical protein
MDPFDTTPVRLDKVKYTKGEQSEMKLDVGDPLRPISEAGTGRAKTDPEMVALAELHKYWWARTVSNRRPLVCNPSQTVYRVSCGAMAS